MKRHVLFAVTLFAVGCSASAAHAVSYWFDQNGTTAGFGVTDTSTYDWLSGTPWNTDVTGGVGGSLNAWPGGSNEAFFVGAGAATSYTVRLGDTGATNVVLRNFALNTDGTASTTPIGSGSVVIGNVGDTGQLQLNASNSIGTYNGTLTVNNPLNLGSNKQTNFRGGTVVLNGVVSGTGSSRVLLGAGAYGLTSGTLTLANTANTYSGRLNSDYIGAGYTLEVTKLDNGGFNSSIGTSSANIGINGGTLRFIGTGAQSTNLGFHMASGGTNVDASGPTSSDTISFSGAPTFSAVDSARTLTLTGTNTGNNTIAFAYANNGTGVNVLTKTGVGRWVVTNANSYTGNTNIQNGTLVASNTAAFGAAGRIVNLGTSSTTGIADFATDTTVNAYVINVGSGNTGTILVNRATTGAAITHSMGTATIGNGTLNVQAGGNVTSGTPTLEFAAINLSAGAAGLGTATLNPTTANISVVGSLARPGSQANSLTLDGTSTGNTISGVISGALIVNKNNSSTWTFSNANTYTGTTTVNGGLLVLTNNLAIQNSAFDTSGAGTLDVTGINTPTFGGLTSGTNYNLPANVTSLTLNPQSGTVTYSGDLGGGAAGLTLTKTGAGTQVLSGSNVYSGLTTISGGELRIQNAAAIGGNNVTVTSGRLALATGISVPNTKSITVNGDGSNFFGALQSMGGTSNTWAGGVLLGADLTRVGTAGASSTLTVSGVIDDGANTFSLMTRNESATGVVVLSGANTYGGNTQMVGGTTRLDSGNDRLPIGTVVQMGLANVSGIFDLNGRNQEIAGLTVTQASGTFTNEVTSAAAATLTVNSVAPSTYSGLLSGSLSLAKIGGDTFTLTGGSNSFSGGTTITAGTLLANNTTGSATGSGGVVINGGKFGGTGSIDGGVTLNSGGTLSPGASIESLATGANAWSGGSTFDFEFATDGTGTAGIDWDLLAITGDLDLTGASSGNPITFNLFTMSSATTPGSLGTWDPNVPHTWAGFATTTTGIAGYAANKFNINTAGFQNPINGTFSVVQNGLNLDLNYVPIPEPSTLAMLAFGMMTLWLFRKRN